MKKGKCDDHCESEESEYFPNGITNGAAWYPITGGQQDWNYHQCNCFELTIELGCRKYPPSAKLAEYWRSNLDSIIRFINAVHTGIRGFVLDPNGSPIEGAIIAIAGIDKNITTYKSGDYWRLTVPYNYYTVSVHKPGYVSQRQSIYVEQVHQLNFTLLPSS